MSVLGYQSDNVKEFRESALFKIEPEHISGDIIHAPLKNNYIITPDNIVLSVDIRLKFSNGTGAFPLGYVMSLPMPKNGIDSLSGTVFSSEGNSYLYEIDGNGLVQIFGDITNMNEEVLFNFKPYVADYPINYLNISQLSFLSSGGNAI